MIEIEKAFLSNMPMRWLIATIKRVEWLIFNKQALNKHALEE